MATGHITDDEARTHPRRNIVTRALGIDPSVRVDAWTLPLVRGDRFLLCSDGLVDEVRDDDIVGVLTTVTDPQAAADELVALANRQGGRDNITVIVVDVLDGADAPDPDTELDLEPAWEDTGAPGTWAVDAPEGEATDVRRPGRPRQRRRRRRTADGRAARPPPSRPTAADDRRGAGRRRRHRREAQAAPARVPRRPRRPRRPRAGVRDRLGVRPPRLLRRLRRARTTSSCTAARTAASCGSIRRWSRGSDLNRDALDAAHDRPGRGATALRLPRRRPRTSSPSSWRRRRRPRRPRRPRPRPRSPRPTTPPATPAP